ncbi:MULTISPECIES: CGA synthase-related protein [Kitasatospora]|uniref:CGA synthase-related protein n=1 Tax=Kitasatospora cystarginea TaxID=58350 RepID=A0ABN3EUY9_9ACTN
MAVLTAGRGEPVTPGRRVLLAAREEQLDSLLALRHVAAHLGGLRPVHLPPGDAPLAPAVPEHPPTDPALPDPPLPEVALVCDDEAATGRLLELGIPVVHLSSGHAGPAPARPAERALHRQHRPGWLLGPTGGARPTGALAPTRLTRNRHRAGALLLLSAWDVPNEELEAFAAGPLRALVHEAVRRTGHCEVVCDTRLAPVHAALDGLTETLRCPDPDPGSCSYSTPSPSPSPSPDHGPGAAPRYAREPGLAAVRVHRAAEVDVDALHAAAEVFLAAPTLGALVLAQARRAPLGFVPPLGAAQRDLAARVTELVPVPLATDPGDPSLWVPPEDGAVAQWSALDPSLDDLRGAQRVARTLRQLSLAPL